jgi:hypothetical protein
MAISSFYIHPAILKIIEITKINTLTFVVTFLILWGFVIYVVIRAKRVRKDDRSVITNFEAPKDISAILARYIFVAGRQGGRAGEISPRGLQTIALIDLYENGGIKELTFIDENTIEYEIDSDYKNKKLNKEQLLFIEFLNKATGMKSKLVPVDIEDDYKGFKGIDDFWFQYWETELYKICVERGYFKKTDLYLAVPLSLLAASMMFGIFFSFFFMLIPYVGLILMAIALFPIVIIILLSTIIIYILSSIFNFDPNSISGLSLTSNFFGLVIIPFLSWFMWFYLLGQNIKIAFTPITETGKDVLLQIKGYKKFLDKVDKDRLSFSLNKDLDYERNTTTFSWLAVFGLAYDRHWDLFYEAHNIVSKPNIITTI